MTLPPIVVTPPAISVVEAYVGACSCLEFVHEEPYGSNRGAVIERIQRATGNKPPDAWCASACADVGQRMFGKRWPLPLTASCNDLAAYALDHDALVLAAGVHADLAAHGLYDAAGKLSRGVGHFSDAGLVGPPELGDLCLLYDAAKHHFHHAGVVRGLTEDGDFLSWEGNTIPPGASGDQREGYGYFKKQHALGGPWGYVRWVRLYNH